MSHHIYTDGSVQADGRAGCATFSPDTQPPEEGWIGSRLPAHSSSTFCELQGVSDAVSLLCQRILNGIVICDSQAALHGLTSPSTVSSSGEQNLDRPDSAHDRSLVIKFVWIPHMYRCHTAKQWITRPKLHVACLPMTLTRPLPPVPQDQDPSTFPTLQEHQNGQPEGGQHHHSAL